HVPRRYLNLYLVIDLFSRFPVAWTISRKENAAVAQHLFAHALDSHAIDSGRLVVHQDRGAPMIAHSYRDFIDGFGVRRSYSRPRVSNDNAFSEACFKTVKYSPGYPGRFAGIDEARAWVAGFIADYQHRPHEGLNFHTPADVFHGRVEAVHAARQAALDAHFAAHPERYPNGPPQAKRPPATVAINPDDGPINAASIGEDPNYVATIAEPIEIPKKDNVM
ncbi:MAG TPA: DDE-type integrase/transposase/recombinase, partial [Alphaproteobacteria bacterium]|nr:DDE-type integrase/transposase/recombinase [Alphaproteobacteria bacterium]